MRKLAVALVVWAVSTAAMAQQASTDGGSIDFMNALNHRTCIAGGGLWDYSVVRPTAVPGHPFVGSCRGKEDRPVCPLKNMNSKCWAFVNGDAQNRTKAKALPTFRACRTHPPDPLC